MSFEWGNDRGGTGDWKGEKRYRREPESRRFQLDGDGSDRGFVGSCGFTTSKTKPKGLFPGLFSIFPRTTRDGWWAGILSWKKLIPEERRCPEQAHCGDDTGPGYGKVLATEL